MRVLNKTNHALMNSMAALMSWMFVASCSGPATAVPWLCACLQVQEGSFQWFRVRFHFLQIPSTPEHGKALSPNSGAFC